MRTDSIGPWLEILNFLTWLATLTNSALLYLFQDGGAQNDNSTKLNKDNIVPDNSFPCNRIERDLLFKAVVIALAASHGYILVRVIIRHIVEKIVWTGCNEVEEAERITREMKEQYLKSIGGVDGKSNDVDASEQAEGMVFWGYDEGLDEIRRTLKDD